MDKRNNESDLELYRVNLKRIREIQNNKEKLVKFLDTTMNKLFTYNQKLQVRLSLATQKINLKNSNTMSENDCQKMMDSLEKENENFARLADDYTNIYRDLMEKFKRFEKEIPQSFCKIQLITEASQHHTIYDQPLDQSLTVTNRPQCQAQNQDIQNYFSVQFLANIDQKQIVQQKGPQTQQTETTQALQTQFQNDEINSLKRIEQNLYEGTKEIQQMFQQLQSTPKINTCVMDIEQTSISQKQSTSKQSSSKKQRDKKTTKSNKQKEYFFKNPKLTQQELIKSKKCQFCQYPSQYRELGDLLDITFPNKTVFAHNLCLQPLKAVAQHDEGYLKGNLALEGINRMLHNKCDICLKPGAGFQCNSARKQKCEKFYHYPCFVTKNIDDKQALKEIAFYCDKHWGKLVKERGKKQNYREKQQRRGTQEIDDEKVDDVFETFQKHSKLNETPIPIPKKKKDNIENQVAMQFEQTEFNAAQKQNTTIFKLLTIEKQLVNPVNLYQQQSMKIEPSQIQPTEQTQQNEQQTQQIQNFNLKQFLQENKVRDLDRNLIDIQKNQLIDIILERIQQDLEQLKKPQPSNIELINSPENSKSIEISKDAFKKAFLPVNRQLYLQDPVDQQFQIQPSNLEQQREERTQSINQVQGSQQVNPEIDQENVPGLNQFYDLLRCQSKKHQEKQLQNDQQNQQSTFNPEFIDSRAQIMYEDLQKFRNQFNDVFLQTSRK